MSALSGTENGERITESPTSKPIFDRRANQSWGVVLVTVILRTSASNSPLATAPHSIRNSLRDAPVKSISPPPHTNR